MIQFPLKTACAGIVVLGLLAGNALAADRAVDEDISYWVKDALRHDDRVEASEINVSAKDGIVTLSGVVDSLAAKTYAGREARKIKDVLGVVDKLSVAASWRSDTDIRHAVKRRILSSAVIESEGLGVSSLDGEVTLSGEVASWTESEEARLLAEEVRGVKEVHNNLTVHWKTSRSDDEIDKDAKASLERDSYLSGLPISVSVSDGVITLSGLVGSAYEKERARSDVRWISHVKGVKNDLVVEWFENRGARKQKPAPSNAELAASVRAELQQDTRVNAKDIKVDASFGHVTLSGSVYSHYQKKTAEQDAHSVVGVGWVTNNLFTRVDKREDWAVRDDIAFNLATDYALEGHDITTKVKDGIVTLSGQVHTWAEKSHANDVASKVRGVKSVINRLAVHLATTKKDASIVESLKNRLRWNWTTSGVHNDITVAVTNGVAELTGDVNTWAERAEAGRVASQTDGVWRTDNRLTVNGYEYEWADWYYTGPYVYDAFYYDPDYYYMW